MKRKKLLATGSGLGSLLLAGAALAVAPTPAFAAPVWTACQMTSTTACTPIAVGDVVSGHGNVTFTATVNGSPTRLECRVAAGTNLFEYTVQAADVPLLSAAPGGTISISQASPVTTLSSSDPSDPKYAVCEDTTGTVYGSGDPVDVTVDTTVLFTLNTVAPAAPAGGVGTVFTGTQTGSVVIPANAITLEAPTIGCAGKGPAVTSTYTGSATVTAGSPPVSTVTPSPNQALSLTTYAYGGNPACTVTNAKLASAIVYGYASTPSGAAKPVSFIYQ